MFSRRIFGFIAVLDDAGALQGWNVTVGGGMGMTHGEPDTYPRTADLMGFCRPEDALKVAEAVVTCSATGATAPTASTRG
jgi:sulfite reductase (NADPH) hemoprotein beta-component